MAEEFLIRLLVDTDKPQFLTLVDAYISEYVKDIEKTYPVHYDPTASAVYWADVTSPTSGYIEVVAEAHGQLIGICSGKIHPSEGVEKVYLSNKIHGGVEELYVDPAYRSRGVGKLLLTEIAEVFLAHGCKDMVLKGVDTGNVRAQKLYENLGFTPWHTDFYKSLK